MTIRQFSAHKFVEYGVVSIQDDAVPQSPRAVAHQPFDQPVLIHHPASEKHHSVNVSLYPSKRICW